MNKKVYVILLVFIVILSVNAINANEHSNETLELHESSSEISVHESPYEDYLTQNESSFTDLQHLINSDEELINLNNDYAFDNDEDSLLSEGIVIENKNLFLQGNGFTLDGASQSRIFKIINSNVTINNVKFINGNGNIYGGAIYAENSALNILNSEFIQNTASVTNYLYNTNDEVNSTSLNGGAVYSTDDITCENCNFTQNSLVLNSNLGQERNVIVTGKDYEIMGGALYSLNNILLTECNFLNNSIVVNVIFNKNPSFPYALRDGKYYVYGGAAYANGNVTSINSQFIKNSITQTKTVIPETGRVSDGYYFLYGGAISSGSVVSSLNSTYNNNYINSSYARYASGGAVYVAGNASFKNDKFVGNSLLSNGWKNRGLAIYVSADNCEIDNCIFTNHHPEGYGVVYLEDFEAESSTCVISNSKFENNTVNCIYSDGGYNDNYNINIISCVFNNNLQKSAIYFDIPSYGNHNMTINKCNFTNNAADGSGGSIYVYGSYGYLIISESNFENNHVMDDSSGYPYGGAIYIYGNLIANNCNFTNNSGECGGAIYVGDRASAVIGDCLFINNTASGSDDRFDGGGAIFFNFLNNHIYEWESAYISNLVFINNTAQNGGAIYAYDESGIIADNCSFINNSAIGNGGALFLDASNKEYLYNFTFCTFINNSANVGGAVYYTGRDEEENAGIFYTIFDGNNALKGKDIFVELAYRPTYAPLFNYNYWSMNFTTAEEFINSDILNIDDESFCPENWVLMSIYGNDPLKVYYNESFIATFDRICSNERIISSFDGILPDYWTSVYVYEGQLFASNDLLGASQNSLLGAEADYNHEWNNENVDVGEFISNIWLRNNIGNFYYTPQAQGSYTFRTHSPFTIWEEAVFSTNAVLPVADLEINKTVNQNIVNVGGSVIWTITVINNGPDIAFNVTVSDILDGGLEYLNSSASRGSYDFERGIWSIGNLTNGGVAILNITTIANKLGIIVNKVNVSTISDDPDLLNNDDDANITVVKQNETTINNETDNTISDNETSEIPVHNIDDNLVPKNNVSITNNGNEVSRNIDVTHKNIMIDSKSTGNPIFLLLIVLLLNLCWFKKR